MSEQNTYRVVVLISANQEWQTLKAMTPDVDIQTSPYGEYFVCEVDVDGRREAVAFFYGGWGKISAAASTQYVISRWSPTLLINLGTCGGFEGAIEKGTIILVERTVVYDIINQIGSFDYAIEQYRTEIDLSWLRKPYPQAVLSTLMVSGDRDLIADEIPQLKADYGAVAGDWESGAIAWVATRNNTRCLILRGVSDLVSNSGGEAYEGNRQVFVDGTRQVFEKLLPHLPQWITLGLS